MGWYSSAEISARLRALIGRPEVSEAYIRFRLDLFEAQQAARRALAAKAASPHGPEPAVAAGPVGPGNVVFPTDLLATLFEAIHTSSMTYGHETADLQHLRAAVAADPGLLPASGTAAAFGPDLAALASQARGCEVYPDALLFVGRALAAPCVAEAVRARLEHGAAGHQEAAAPNRCPHCAAVPSVARLRRADGPRILSCGLCGSEWEAVRLACTCCGTLDHALLGLLRLNDRDARWIETCEACKGYIKTVDERRLPEGEPIFPVVEEAATLHLDLLAEREGYIRRVPYVLAG